MKNKNRRLRSLSYMTVSLGLFFLSLILSAVLIVRAVLTDGGLGRADAVLGTLALAAVIAGFIVPLYGHFIVRIDGKANWRLGVLLNGVLMLFLVFLYFLGIS